MSAAKDLLLSAFLARRAGRMVRESAEARQAVDPTKPSAPTGAALASWQWPRGQLIEILVDEPGQAEIELCLPQLQTDRQSDTLWILPWSPRAVERPFHPFANRLERAGLPSRLQHVHQAANPRATWCLLEQALRSRQFSHVIAWVPRGSQEGDYRGLRRLQALVSGSATRCILVRDPVAADAPTPACLRLRIEPGLDTRAREGVRARQLSRRGQGAQALSHFSTPRAFA